ncbi:hypothetical protein FNH07_28115 [Amycolatopsis bartoniae]|nr:hypothetical protein FNH07_28115 [Amycolatopsis bartoniae]
MPSETTSTESPYVPAAAPAATLVKVRRVGAFAHARGFASHDHLCWSYRDRHEFRARAREFLADGLAEGQRVHYLTATEDAGLGLDGVEVSLVHENYTPGAVVDPAAQARSYAEATDRALRDGFTGFRVAADVTGLVRTPTQLAAFGRYEHLADHVMATRPFTAMCAYDRRALAEDVVTHLASLHPASNAEPPFRLYACGTDGVSLAGELDLAGRTLLSLALERADLCPGQRSLYVEASGVRFIDHRALVALAEHARGRGFDEVVLRTGLRSPARLVELLGLDGIRVEAG